MINPNIVRVTAIINYTRSLGIAISLSHDKKSINIGVNPNDHFPIEIYQQLGFLSEKFEITKKVMEDDIYIYLKKVGSSYVVCYRDTTEEAMICKVELVH